MRQQGFYHHATADSPWNDPRSYAPDLNEQLAEIEYCESRARHYRKQARKARVLAWLSDNWLPIALGLGCGMLAVVVPAIVVAAVLS